MLTKLHNKKGTRSSTSKNNPVTISNGSVVMTEQQLPRTSQFRELRKEGKQVSIKGHDGRVKVVVGTGGRTKTEKEHDSQELERLYQEINATPSASTEANRNWVR